MWFFYCYDAAVALLYLFSSSFPVVYLFIYSSKPTNFYNLIFETSWFVDCFHNSEMRINKKET